MQRAQHKELQNATRHLSRVLQTPKEQPITFRGRPCWISPHGKGRLHRCKRAGLGVKLTPARTQNT